MALTPSAPLTPAEKRAQRDAAEQEVLLREVDEAVRQGDFESFAKTWGRKLVALIVVLLALFGGYLFWQDRQNRALEADSEILISATDQLEVGNLPAANDKLAPLVAKTGGGAGAVARLMRAGLEQQQGKTADAIKTLNALAADQEVAVELRELATLRATALQYDSLDKAKAIAALKPLAVPGKPYFASAGELLAHAYLDTGKKAEAGALFAQIAKDETAPETLRARSRQMAGVLGIDAVDPKQVAAASGQGSAQLTAQPQ